MPRGLQLTDFLKGQIEAFHLEKFTERATANKIRLSKTVLYNYFASKTKVNPKKRTGNPSKLTAMEARSLLREAAKEEMSALALRKSLFLPIKERIICQALNESGRFKENRMKYVPKPNPIHKQRQVSGAKFISVIDSVGAKKFWTVKIDKPAIGIILAKESVCFQPVRMGVVR